MPDATQVIDARDVRVVYQRGGQPAVDDVSFGLAPGEGLVVAGERGSGKSSLLRALCGLVLPVGGEVAVFGARAGSAEATRRTGYGPQGRTFMDGRSALALVGVVGALRTGTRDPDAARGALRASGLPDSRERRPARELDVEEIRRVSLACALVGEPDLLVLDDPWEFVETVDAVNRTRERGGAVVVATHDPGGFPGVLGRTITLVDGAAR